MDAIEHWSFLDVAAGGGPVMWVILGVGALGIIIFIERLLHLHRGQIRAREFIDGIRNNLGRRRLVEALTLCEDTPGPVAAVVKAALLSHGEGEARIRLAIEEAAAVEVPALERRLGSLAALAQAAPLLGLLGTLLGMAAVFIVFQDGGSYATPESLAGGVWGALTTSVAGLTIAVPLHLAYHFLNGRVRSILLDMEWAGVEILRLLRETPVPAEIKQERHDNERAAL